MSLGFFHGGEVHQKLWALHRAVCGEAGFLKAVGVSIVRNKIARENDGIPFFHLTHCLKQWRIDGDEGGNTRLVAEFIIGGFHGELVVYGDGEDAVAFIRRIQGFDSAYPIFDLGSLKSLANADCAGMPGRAFSHVVRASVISAGGIRNYIDEVLLFGRNLGLRGCGLLDRLLRCRLRNNASASCGLFRWIGEQCAHNHYYNEQSDYSQESYFQEFAHLEPPSRRDCRWWNDLPWRLGAQVAPGGAVHGCNYAQVPVARHAEPFRARRMA